MWGTTRTDQHTFRLRVIRIRDHFGRRFVTRRHCLDRTRGLFLRIDRNLDRTARLLDGGDCTDLLLLDVTPLSLGVGTIDDSKALGDDVASAALVCPLIKRNTTVPARKRMTFIVAISVAWGALGGMDLS